MKYQSYRAMQQADKTWNIEKVISNSEHRVLSVSIVVTNLRSHVSASLVSHALLHAFEDGRASVENETRRFK